MPQISKIRIVNCCYNDGNRLIPDELFDLSSPESDETLNSLFNLNNGGGKTVLVQLIMQPVKPHAMAGSRHIEEYFLRSSDHSYVLIEWKKDNSREKLLTGISIAASQSQSEENTRGNSIKYYTFKTEYTDHSPYSIETLDLSKNVNGRFVPESFDYVREKAKASKGALEYYSSDESVKWTTQLLNYGILRSEWESVIEPLNRDEGGLSQYFEDAKTSDKLLNKFIIPAIDQKLKSASSKGMDSSLETMLCNYAKKISEKDDVIKERDTNQGLLKELNELAKISGELVKINDRRVDSIGVTKGFRQALNRKITQTEGEITDLEEQIENENKNISHIDHEEKSKNYYLADDKFKKENESFVKAKILLDTASEKVSLMKHRADVLMCAKAFNEINECEGKISGLKQQIDDKENNSDAAQRIGSLKYSIKLLAENDLEKNQNTSEKLQGEKNVKEKEKDELSAGQADAKQKLSVAKDVHTGLAAELSVNKKHTDALVEKLELPIMRRLDGFYPEDEIVSTGEQKKKEKADREEKAKLIQHEISAIDEEAEKIPYMISDIKVEIGRKENIKEIHEKALGDYEEAFLKITEVCARYSLESDAAFSDRLRRTVREDKELSEANISGYKKEIEDISSRLEAAKKGNVHILPKIMEYIGSTGVDYQTGERYICSLMESGSISCEKADSILKKYPEIAYSLIFNDSRNLNLLINAGNADWLAAAVPLFTMEQMNLILKEEMSPKTFLAVYDKDYFADKAGYMEKLNSKKLAAQEALERYKEHLKTAAEDLKLTESFEYSKEYRTELEKELSRIQKDIRELNYSIKELEEKKRTLVDKKELLKTELEKLKAEILKLERSLEDIEGLKAMMKEEISLNERLEKALFAMEEAQEKYEEITAELSETVKQIEELSLRIKETELLMKEVSEILDKVSGAAENEVIAGDLRTLYHQYRSESESLDKDLKTLRADLDDEEKKCRQAKEELSVYGCDKEEYEKVIFTVSGLTQVKTELKVLEKEKDRCQGVYNECYAEYSAAKQRFDLAKDALAVFDGILLSKTQIGKDFKKRKGEAEAHIKKMNFAIREKNGIRGKTDKVLSGVNIYMDESFENVPVIAVELSEVVESQWDALLKELKRSGNAFGLKKDEFNRMIGDTIREYRSKAFSEMILKLDMIAGLLENDRIKGDKLFTVNESISAMISSVEKINKKIETDLKEIENDFSDIVDQCMNQGKRIYDDLRMIAGSSKVHIFEGKPQVQMVKFDLPEEKEISEEASRVSIKTEIEHGANEIKEMLAAGTDMKDIRKKAAKIISSERLLHRYIRRESVQVKVYKIDINSENSTYKRWEDALTQCSGAEKFVVFFAVVLTMMNYTRSNAGLVDKNAKSVLVLDNPFGSITSAHLLKPMFDITKRFNVQLICFSDINKSDVVNCFENVVKLTVKKQILSNRAIMTHEGNERIEHGFYKSIYDQMKLF